ncbi:hypothetical protein [Cohnella sp. 56]|uniref:hypothetical protein n=1 Tax=Cohnella sp. 56 TaxID=3113722 RepID=UPI0030EB068F
MKLNVSLINTISSVLMQLVTLVIGFVLPRLYLSEYGSEVNGIINSITQFIMYLTLVEAGLSSAIISSLYYPLSQGNNQKLSEILLVAKKFYIKTGYAFTGLLAVMAFLYPLLVSHVNLSYLEIVLLVCILGSNISFEFFFLSRYKALLTADQKYYVVANTAILFNILGFVIVVISINLSYSVIVVRAIWGIFGILRVIFINFYVKKKYKFVEYSLNTDKNTLNARWDAMILQLLGLAQTSFPILMITIVLNDLKLVSVYSIYNMVALSIVSVLAAITNGFANSFGNMVARTAKEELKKSYRSFEFLFCNLIAWIYSCANILYIPFVSVYTSGISDTNYIQPLTAVLFVVNGILYSLKSPAGMLIGAAGLFKETKVATIIQTIILMILSFVLVPTIGLAGILIALIISNLYRTIELVIFMAKNVTHIPHKETFIRMGKSVIAILMVNFPFLFIEIHPSRLIDWIFCSLAVAAWSLIFLFVFNALFARKDLINLISLSSRFKHNHKGVIK